MTRGSAYDDLDAAVGYVLKRASHALRTSMETVLRPLGLTVPQYACLELLGQRPDLSNAELARAAFVTRQSMNLVLRGLQDRGLVARADSAAQGRARPSRLTDDGRRCLAAASAAVRGVEERMLRPFTPAERQRLRDDLTRAEAALAGP